MRRKKRKENSKHRPNHKHKHKNNVHTDGTKKEFYRAKQFYEPLTKEDKTTRTKRAATARPERIWDYGVIPYEIEANFSGK